jgi:ATP-dependent Lon protease
VGVTSAVEVPTMIAGRWATECSVVEVSADTLVLRGERRVRVVSTRGTAPPYVAETEEGGDVAADLPKQLVAGGHALFAALEAGARPFGDGAEDKLAAAVAGVVRAVAGPEELRQYLRVPPGEALEQLARSLASRAAAHEASCRLEAALRTMTEKPALDEEGRRRLWSEVVQIMRRLDLYDPATAEETRTDLARLQQRLQQAGLPREAREVAKRELRLLRSMQPDHHDYATYTAHLDWMARLAWHAEELPRANLDDVAVELDREHSGLEKPKRRILEHLAVHALGGAARSTVLCFVGPPGVGKTSIARAIAAALGRKFVRVALGGVHDESEIRGHRMSFVAAAPGRIISGMGRAGTATPVVLLDEIDKIGSERARSPDAALLEVLDPEQNTHFYDNYLAVPYDLSRVLFICTANDLSDVNDALRDRLEAIDLDGYTVAEKMSIARASILPKLRADCGLPEALVLDDDALSTVIDGHTREAGVRQLRRALEGVHRARALTVARLTPGEKPPPPPCDRAEVERALGPSRFVRAIVPESLPVGVSVGLAVGAEGGSIIFIEVASLPGKGELRMTGRLGEVMREAAQAALALLRSDPQRWGAAPEALEQHDFHVHVPEAATPKDGPSAGIALFCAFLSAATRRPLRADVALTGELTLSGRVLPVGGVRAKVLAAERAGVRRVVVPEDCRADVPKDLRIEVVYVRELREAVDAAEGLTPSSASSPAPAARATSAGDGGRRRRRA